jgi:DNA-binding transcriptional LysR family regulator
VEFGVVSLPVKDLRLHIEVIHRDELVLVVPAVHQLASFDSLSLQQLAKQGLLVPKQGRRRESLDQIFLQNKLSPHITMELDSNELLKRLIIAEVGIGFLPRINILDELKQGILRAIPVEGVQLPRDLALISRHDRPLTRAGNAFFTFATGNVRPAPLSE